MLDDKKFKKRADIIVSLVLVWAIVCIATFFYYAVIAKNKYINLGNKLARRELLYYPQRSKIIDKNGVVLAWSEKYYDLYYNDFTGSPGRVQFVFEKVKIVLPGARMPGSNNIHSLVFRNLSARHILALEKLINLFQELQISTRIERKVVDYPEIKVYIGDVKLVSGRHIGINGIEKEYDDILNGEPGKYRIMLDRNKNWIKGSGKSIKMAIPGQDIRLPLTLAEIRRRKGHETGTN